MSNVIDEVEKEIIQKLKDGKHQSTKLETDDKVLARVTDGIYRVPGSAIRELISNAYDADAENVYVNTDVPRFESMTIRDDGTGMSIDTLVNMIRHIGGSSKRSERGKELKVTDHNDNSLSFLKKRKLIGKIGIGLFSVAQLTRDFEIVTKQKGTGFYLRAKVSLFNYSDELAEVENDVDGRGRSFQTGNVEIWTEKTDNLDAHGTDIILHNIKKSAQDQLRSVDIWAQTENETNPDEDDELNTTLDSSKAMLPDFHVGYLSNEDSGAVSYSDNSSRLPVLPWDEHTDPEKKFIQLYNSILSKTKNAVSPKLNLILDSYLNMIWTLGLSVPLEYIDRHPFQLTKEEIPDVYVINNKQKGQVNKIYDTLLDGVSIGDSLNLISHKRTYDFNVYIDEIKLYRPIKYKDLPESKARVKKPILFIGKYKPDLSTLNPKDSGGELEFEAYILWSPKVSPRDHNGSLIRINDASGVLFDETFMKHQVAEHTIKSQLTAEIFVSKGMDSALNIDRESFNIAHPHYQIVMRWLHNAIRQVVNRYKIIKKEVQIGNNQESGDVFISNLDQIVSRSYVNNKKDPNERSNLVMLDDDSLEIKEFSFNSEVTKDELGLKINNLTDNFVVKESNLKSVFIQISKNKVKQKNLISRSEAILQILDSYNLLDNLTVDKQQSLVLDLIKVLSVEV